MACLDVGAVHVHEDVADHDHGRGVVRPGRVEHAQEVVVDRGLHVLQHLYIPHIHTHSTQSAVTLAKFAPERPPQIHEWLRVRHRTFWSACVGELH